MRRFLAGVCAAVLALSAAAFAAGQAPEAKDQGVSQLQINELYSITPATAPSTEEFTASPVKPPEDMHVGVSNDPFSVEVGDMILSPIPRRLGN